VDGERGMESVLGERKGGTGDGLVEKLKKKS
jgi:hypothetical protein